MSNVGKMAVIPYVDEDWCRHSVQWQMYSFRGLGRGVVKRICEHWQRPSIFSCMTEINYGWFGLRWVLRVSVAGLV